MFLSPLPLPHHSQLTGLQLPQGRLQQHLCHPGAGRRRWGGSSHPWCHDPDSPAVLAAAPSPAGHQRCGLAVVDDAVRGLCYTPELLVRVWWLASVQLARPQPKLTKTAQGTSSGQLELCGV